MKTKALFLCLLLSLGSAWADDVDFSDGRSCRGCVAEIKQGFAVSVKDKEGAEWLDPQRPNEITVVSTSSRWWPSSKRYTTPAGAPPVQDEFLDKFGRAVAGAAIVGAQGYNQNYARQPLRNTSCNTIGSQTNCMSY